MIQAEEITDKYDGNPIHVNATNLLEFIPPQGGASTYDVLQRNIDAVNKQREETGRSMIAHVNHPNFGWGIVAEDLIDLQGNIFSKCIMDTPESETGAMTRTLVPIECGILFWQ